MLNKFGVLFTRLAPSEERAANSQIIIAWLDLAIEAVAANGQLVPGMNARVKLRRNDRSDEWNSYDEAIQSLTAR
jgi:hypothetical protein